MSTARYRRNELPPLTEIRKEELKAAAGRPAEEIDFSDIPPLDENFWKNAVRNPFCKPVKVHASIRLDADVMAWLKSMGKGYQTRINEILRQAMLESMQSKVQSLQALEKQEN